MNKKLIEAMDKKLVVDFIEIIEFLTRKGEEFNKEVNQFIKTKLKVR